MPFSEIPTYAAQEPEPPSLTELVRQMQAQISELQAQVIQLERTTKELDARTDPHNMSIALARLLTEHRR